MFHPLSPKAKSVLLKLAAKIDSRQFTFGQAVAASGEKRDAIAPYFLEFVRKGCLNKPERAHYEFFHGLFLQFLKRQVEDGRFGNPVYGKLH